MTDRFELLIVPGYTNSGPQHWQSLWQQRPVRYRRVEQRSWDRPEAVEWASTIVREIEKAVLPVVLVGHSLGCLGAVNALLDLKSLDRVIGAFLVAPCDPTGEHLPDDISGFVPARLSRLPVASLVVASSNDPYASLEWSQSAAEAWGSEFINVGARGHINTASNLGTWDEGWEILRAFLGRRGLDPGGL